MRLERAVPRARRTAGRRCRRGRRPRRPASRSWRNRSLLPKSTSLPMASTARRTSTPAATLAGSAVEEGRPDVARLVAVDEQVDVVRRGRDVLEHPREVAMAVEEGVDRGRDRRREGQGEVGAADLRAGDELGGAGRGRLGPDRVRVERVGRDARLAPAHGAPSPPRSRPRWRCVRRRLIAGPSRRTSSWCIRSPPPRLPPMSGGGTPAFARSSADTVTRCPVARVGTGRILDGPRRPRTEEDVRCLSSPSRRSARRSSTSPRSTGTRSSARCPSIRMPAVDLTTIERPDVDQSAAIRRPDGDRDRPSRSTSCRGRSPAPRWPLGARWPDRSPGSRVAVLSQRGRAAPAVGPAPRRSSRPRRPRCVPGGRPLDVERG